MADSGFSGTVNSAAYVGMSQFLGPRYGVGSAGALRVTSAGPGMVSVAAGQGFCLGVHTTKIESVNLSVEPASSGSRYDLVALRFDWTANTVTPVIITGTSSSDTLPARNVYDPVGKKEDMPLAQIQVTAGSSTVLVTADLRLWPGAAGVYLANHVLARAAFDDAAMNGVIGTQVRVGDVTYTRHISGSTVAWRQDRLTISLPGNGLTPTDPDTLAIIASEVTRIDDVVSFYVRLRGGPNLAMTAGGGSGMGSLINAPNQQPGFVFAKEALTINDARFRPRYRGMLGTGEYGPVAFGAARSNGVVLITEIGAGTSLVSGSYLDLVGTWIGAEL